METMEMLLDGTESEVYDLELNLLAKAKTYTGKMYGDFSLIFSEKPKKQLPEKIFLLLHLDEQSFISYLCTLSGELIETKDEQSGGKCYKIEVFNEEAETLKDELRVYTSFWAEVREEGRRQSVEVEVKDISVGGIMFITEEKLDVKKTCSFTFWSGKKDITVDVVIKMQRPVGIPGMFGYGGKFLYLSRNQEAEIRSFVFQQDIKRHHQSSRRR